MKQLISILIVLMIVSVSILAQSPVRETYAIKGTDSLWLDHYSPQGKANGMSVLFVHGGAFTSGDPVNQKPFAEGLTRMGYNVFVIKYRLYLKGRGFGCDIDLPEKLKAIRLAVEDTRDATAYLLEHANRLKVDTASLFIAGSSAGAETVLNLVFNPFRKKNDKEYSFYDHFRYAGVLSFSGAVIDINTIPDDFNIPVLMMHGTKDQLVPFGTAAHHFCSALSPGWLMLFGPQTIFDTLKARNCPIILYSYEGRGHEVSSYMFRKFTEMDQFMREAVSGKMKRFAEVWISKDK